MNKEPKVVFQVSHTVVTVSATLEIPPGYDPKRVVGEVEKAIHESFKEATRCKGL